MLPSGIFIIYLSYFILYSRIMKNTINKRQPNSDQEFIIEIQKRNERVTESFYYECRQYFMSFYKTVFAREDIRDDIFQQSFVKLWTEIESKRIFIDNSGNIHRHDRHGNIRRMSCSMKTFLLDIAKNDYSDWIRKEKLVMVADMETAAYLMEVKSVEGQEDTPEAIQKRIVASCISDLPPRCKEILTMFYYDGMSLNEIIIARREKNISKNGLKTGKYKCMETLKSKVRSMYNRYNLVL